LPLAASAAGASSRRSSYGAGNDPAFIAASAEAYVRDLPKAELHLIDAGHFAVEEQPATIPGYILDFMARQGN
jgi:pimeloyl-ACP methyl ester carboxylesterase